MPATPFDSALYGELFQDRELARLFSDTAEVRAMLLVEGALARAEGEVGLIPRASAEFIHRAAREVEIDPAGLADATAANAVPVPALVAEFRRALEHPEHAAHVHWGATSQDIMDTALALRLRRVLEILDARLEGVLARLAELAERHAELPAPGRTWGQLATPTSFGAIVAGWGWPLLALRRRLPLIRPEVLRLSLSGAAGTLSVLGEEGREVRARMARALGLLDPGHSWHANREGVALMAGFATAIAGAAGKMGEDLLLMVRGGEVRLGGGGASSTMPQKVNPVRPSLMVALARHAAALAGGIGQAVVHGEQRDGAAWMLEWLSLPQLIIAAGRGLTAAAESAASLAPVPERLAAALNPDGLDLVHAEALSFALARLMSRGEAKAAVQEAVEEARRTGRPLAEIARRRWPELDSEGLFDPARQLGLAPEDARSFAEEVRAFRQTAWLPEG